MADQTQSKGFDVNAALQSGASEDQVYDYLKKSTPGFDFASAEKQPGVTKRQIIDYVAQHPKSSPPGAVSRFASGFAGQFNPMPALQTAGRVISDVSKNNFGAAGEELKGVAVGNTEQYGPKAVEARKEGHPLDWLMYSAGATPMVGAPIAEGYEKIKSGDVAGGLGTWGGMLGALALPHGVAKVAGKASELAPHVYGGALDLSLRTDEELRQVRERGLGRAEPKAAPPDKPVVANKKGLKETQQRITDTKKEQMARVNAATNAGTIYDLNTVLKPVFDAADEWIRYGASPELGEKLREMAENFRNRHPDGMGGFTVTPDELQKFKEVTDDQIRSWTEGAEDTTGGEKFRRLTRTAFDQTLDTIPDVKDMNWAMHLDHALSDAIEEGLRAKKFTAAQLAETGMGITGVELISRGYVKSGSTLIVGAVVREAMRNPAAMTRLGVLLDKAGTKVPPILQKGMTAGALAAWGARQQQQRTGKSQPSGQVPPGAGTAEEDLRTTIERWVH